MKRFGNKMCSVAVLALLICFLLPCPKSLFADSATESWSEKATAKQEAPAQSVSSSSQDLLDKVTTLNKRVEELETKLAEKAAPVKDSDRMKLLEDRLSAQEKLGSSTSGGGLSLDSLPAGQFLKDTKISGFVDASYKFNFNQPATLSNNPAAIAQPAVAAPVTGSSANIHPFDRNSNDFTLNLVEVVLEKTADPIGYRVDLDFGQDAEVIHASGLGAVNESFDLQQAYLTYKLPMDKVCSRWKCLDGLTGNIMAGKFVTLAGAEVIESKDNWNTSRSFMFSTAIPFTHTGVRTNWNYKGFDLAAGVNNGWDVAQDNNQAKTIESRLGYTYCDWLSQGVVYIFGSEKANKSGDQRHLLDLVTTVKNPLKGKEFEWLNKLTLMFNMDWATEQDAQRFDQGGIGSAEQNDPNVNNPTRQRFGNSEARWHGYAAYAKYDLFPWWTIANRLEYFADTDGSRTFRQQDLWEYTVTNQFNVIKNLITRLEFRHDGSDKSVFSNANVAGGVTETRSYQDILYLEAIYAF